MFAGNGSSFFTQLAVHLQENIAVRGGYLIADMHSEGVKGSPHRPQCDILGLYEACPSGSGSYGGNL